MKKIIIIKNITGNVLKAIRREIPRGSKENIYLVFGDLAEMGRSYMELLGFREERLPDNNPQYRDDFLREYIDLIGSIGKENNTIAWWATDIASKNRFNSRIPELLSSFLSIARIIKNKQFDVLLIVNPDWAIISSLKKACIRDGIGWIMGRGFSAARFLSFIVTRLKTLGSVLYSFGRIVFRSLYCRIKLGKKINTSINESDSHYLIKTFIYNHSFSEEHNYKDVFFGKIPDLLNKKNKVCIFAYIFGDYGYCLREIKECNSFKIVPVEFFARFFDMISALKTAFLSRIGVSKKYFYGYEVSDIIRNELDLTWNGIQYYQLLHYWFLKRLLARLKTDTFLFTYENNPWEKMCISALKEVSPNTFIIGYQHTIVAHASANMFPSRYESESALLPDEILTVGRATKDIMERYGNFKDTPIRASCAVRFEYLFKTGRIQRKNERNILVALEGVKEVHRLAAYVLRELGGNGDYKVRIRTHPVLPWEYLEKRHGFNLARYPNFHLSPKGPVEADLEWAGVVIYWGSTVGLEALNIGRPVVHYSAGAILDYDPLFESSAFKWRVDENTRLAAVLEEINSLSEEEYISGWVKAKKYLDNYFFPVTEENMAGFMKLSAIKRGEHNVAK